MGKAEALASTSPAAPASTGAAPLITQVAARETAARVVFATAKSQALAEGRQQAAAARAESAAAISRLRETAAQPTQVLAQAAAHERARMQAAAHDSGHRIATASQQVEQANDAHALAAIAAQDIESNAEERGVRQSVQAGRQAAGHQIDEFVLGTGATVNRAAYDLGAAMDQAIADGQAKTAEGLASTIDELTAAGEAIAAKVEAQTVAILTSLTTAEARFMAGLAQVRSAAARSPHGNPAGLAPVDKALADLGAALGEAAAQSLGSYEGRRGQARQMYDAAIGQLAATAWPQVSDARAQWAQQTTDFVASAAALTGEAVARLLSLNAVLPARFLEIASAAVADARRSRLDKLEDTITSGAGALVAGLGVFVGAALLLGAAIAIVLEAPLLAALAVGAAIVGVSMLIGGAVKAFIERIEALSQQWGNWSVWGRIEAIALSAPAAFSDALGLTGSTEAITRRDSRTGDHLTEDQAAERAIAGLENVIVAAATGKAEEAIHGPARMTLTPETPRPEAPALETPRSEPARAPSSEPAHDASATASKEPAPAREPARTEPAVEPTRESAKPPHDARARVTPERIDGLKQHMGVKVRIDPKLTNGVELHYRVRTGLGTDIEPTELLVGPDALIDDVLIHRGTIDRITEYNGVLGKLRGLRDRFLNGADPQAFKPGSRGWVSVEELRKLDALIEHRRSGWNPKIVDPQILANEIAFLEGRQAFHEEVLRSVEEAGAAGPGHIDSPDYRKVTNEALARGYQLPGKEQGVEPDWYYYRDKRGMPGEYELALRPDAPAGARELQAIVQDGRFIAIDQAQSSATISGASEHETALAKASHPERQDPDTPRIRIAESQLKVVAKPNDAGTRWEFDVDAPLPNGKMHNIATGDVTLGPDGKPKGGPTLFIDKRVTIDGVEYRVSVGTDDGKSLKFSDWVLERLVSKFVEQYKVAPENLSGSLVDDNRAVFQRKLLEYLDLELDRGAAMKMAAAATPFGIARVALDYTEFEVRPSDEEVEIPYGNPPRPRSVPARVYVEVTKR
jgi:hypothetical protein